jgi:hypothetical protein
VRITAETRFAIIPEWVLFAPISPTAVRLYGVMARHADKDEHFSIVSRGKLAEQARVAVHTVDRALAELVAIGAVTVEHRVNPNNPLHLLTNRYLLAVAPPKSAAQSSPKCGTTPIRRTSPSQGGSPKSGIERLERVSGSRGSSTAPASSQPTFADFWRAYPVHKGKRPAEKAWANAIKGTDPGAIIAGAERYAEELATHPNPPSPKWPQGWLNDRRWEDEPLPIPSQSRPRRPDPPRPYDPTLAEIQIDRALEESRRAHG